MCLVEYPAWYPLLSELQIRHIYHGFKLPLHASLCDLELSENAENDGRLHHLQTEPNAETWSYGMLGFSRPLLSCFILPMIP